VCPGGRCIEVVKRGAELIAKTVPPAQDDAFVPSADRLFTSAAKAHGRGVMALVLTGMGDDGAKGAVAVRQAGGTVLAESAETAVVYGMPGATQRTGVVAKSLPIRELAEHLARAIQG
jgi:two-component system chemotaxis response regulator CheB